MDDFEQAAVRGPVRADRAVTLLEDMGEAVPAATRSEQCSVVARRDVVHVETKWLRVNHVTAVRADVREIVTRNVRVGEHEQPLAGVQIGAVNHGIPLGVLGNVIEKAGS